MSQKYGYRIVFHAEMAISTRWFFMTIQYWDTRASEELGGEILKPLRESRAAFLANIGADKRAICQICLLRWT